MLSKSRLSSRIDMKGIKVGCVGFCVWGVEGESCLSIDVDPLQDRLIRTVETNLTFYA